MAEVDWSILGNLGNTYREGQNRRTLADLGKGLAEGTLDYRQAAAMAAQTGDLQTTLGLLNVGREDEASKSFQEMFRPQAAAPQPARTLANIGQPPTQTQQGGGQYAGAISKIESGGRYDIQGPVTRNGDRAYGKYQVMGANIAPWTQEILGNALTREQFLSDPAAQDKVFEAKFGGYVQKHGSPEAAARAWFAGEGGMNNPNARDQLGTTVSSYAAKFNAGMGAQPQQQAQPVQVAQAGGGMQPDSAAPSAPQTDDGGLNNLPPRVLQLIGAASHPRLPAAQKEVAKTLLARELDNSKFPDPVKKYLFAKGQGFTGTFLEFETQLRKSGATVVNVDTKGESKFEEEFGKKQADRWNKYIDEGQAAQRKLVDITAMREISQRVGSQGINANIKDAVGPYAEALGVNIEGLSDIQAYSSIIQRLAPQQRAPGSGSTSDIEFKGFVKSMPGLMQNPAAREMTLDTMEALTRDDMARGDIASRLANKELTRGNAEVELRKLPDPMRGFAEWRKANAPLYAQAVKNVAQPASSAPAKISTPAEWGALRPGTQYIDPDGNIRTKR